ncbi:uncharacterized protein LOC106129199 isoform X2 [Amyelois transitella]|uniref:uncharacterized protein LOC106129199 isoform X2 n=1 Tax=Amyelois transitella TaxID=680683 RepID=UPI002990582E|nr:uncharacterized protein LOC106129199 isoform X2 [Amyelois transitella]
MGSSFWVYARGSWRQLDVTTGRVQGWAARPRFCYYRRGRLHVARPAAVLQGLQALLEKRPTSVRDGLPLSQRRVSVPRPGRSPRRCCCSHNVRAHTDNSRNALVQLNLSTQCANSMPATTTQAVKSDAAIQADVGSVAQVVAHKRKRSPVQESDSITRVHKVPRRREESESSTPAFKELIVSEADVAALRSFALRSRALAVDVRRFDADEAYRGAVFYRLNPLVRLERCPWIAAMLAQDCSLQEFTRSLGLRPVRPPRSHKENCDDINRQRSKPQSKKNSSQHQFRNYTNSKETSHKRKEDGSEDRPWNTKNKENKQFLSKNKSPSVLYGIRPKNTLRKHNKTVRSSSEDSISSADESADRHDRDNRMNRERERRRSARIRTQDKSPFKSDSRLRSSLKEADTNLERTAKDSSEDSSYVWADRSGRLKDRVRQTLERDRDRFKDKSPAKSDKRLRRRQKKTGNNVERIVRDSSEDASSGWANRNGRTKDEVKGKQGSDRERSADGSPAKGDSKSGSSQKKTETNVLQIIRDSSEDSSQNVWDKNRVKRRSARRLSKDNTLEKRVGSVHGDDKDNGNDKPEKKDTELGTRPRDVDSTAKGINAQKDATDGQRVNREDAGGRAEDGRRGDRPQKRRSAVAAQTKFQAQRREYSPLEDHAIVQWLMLGSRARKVNGNVIWRELQGQFSRIAGSTRTWHSLRNRYLRSILPALGALALPPAAAAALRAAQAAGEIKSRGRPSRPNPLLTVPAVRSAWAARGRGRGAPGRGDSAGDTRDAADGEGSPPAPPARRALRPAPAPAARPPAAARSPPYGELTRRFADHAGSAPEAEEQQRNGSVSPPAKRTRKLFNHRTQL